jgi:predicted membrane protein
MLCVTMRVLVGICTAWIFRLVLGASKRKNLSFLIGAVAAPLTNTIFFMGYMVLFFYQTEAIQALASALHATNPLVFIVLLVGLQGVIEVVVSGIVSTLIVKVLSRLLAAQQEIR